MVPRVGRPGRESIDRFIRRSVGAMSRLVASVRTQHTGSAQRSQDERRTKLTASASGSLVCFVIRARLLARPGTTLPRGRRLRWLARRAHRRCETVDSDGGGDDGHRAQVHDLDDRRKLPSGPPPPGTRPTAPSSRAPTPSARSPRRFCCTASAEPDRVVSENSAGPDPVTGSGMRHGTYHGERNHQGLRNELITPATAVAAGTRVRCRDRLGGLLRYYHRAA
jgi:hypothetical protein